MNEALDWSVFTWLFQKGKVREIADQANAALDKLNAATKAKWDTESRSAYKHLTGKERHSHANGDGSTLVDSELSDFVTKVKEADEAAQRARLRAEETFDEAERQLNTELAREGCRQAIHSWELHEKAIRRAETAPNKVKAG
ncbi:MAG TPA: hypothetical protein VLW06_05215 [Terriglobales bacterium]|nr:hypothetical protein [Terriglobales bacterium]